ncbi:MAG: arginine repressor [Desulfotomaculales bacterium]
MKTQRQKKILEIISRQPVQTQKELADALRAEGLQATQATISRDIKELGLVKAPAEKEKARYLLPQNPPSFSREERLKRAFKTSVVSIDASENLVVIKTLPGEAQGVAAALDQANPQGIIGTVAGDDTIIAVVKPRKLVTELLEYFAQLVKQPW